MNTTKLELNDKLAELYGLEAFVYFNSSNTNDAYLLTHYLIDDSARMFDLMTEHEISPDFGEVHIGLTKNDYVRASKRDGLVSINNDNKVFLKDHESPQAALRYAIALVLVQIAESKV